jgi:hypothetical protein
MGMRLNAIKTLPCGWNTTSNSFDQDTQFSTKQCSRPQLRHTSFVAVIKKIRPSGNAQAKKTAEYF